MSGLSPADISVSDISAPVNVNEGDGVSVSATITNSGDFSGIYEVILKLNDAVREKREVEVPGRESVVATFELPGLTAGNYNVEAGDVRKTVAVTAAALPAPVSSETGPLVVSPPEDDAGQRISMQEAEPVPLPVEQSPSPDLEQPVADLPMDHTEPSGSSGWLFFAVGLPVVAAVGIYFTWWRRRGISGSTEE